MKEINVKLLNTVAAAVLALCVALGVCVCVFNTPDKDTVVPGGITTATGPYVGPKDITLPEDGDDVYYAIDVFSTSLDGSGASLVLMPLRNGSAVDFSNGSGTFDHAEIVVTRTSGGTQIGIPFNSTVVFSMPVPETFVWSYDDILSAVDWDDSAYYGSKVLTKTVESVCYNIRGDIMYLRTLCVKSNAAIDGVNEWYYIASLNVYYN